MNLWEESDNPELASIEVGPAQKPGTTRRNSIEQDVLPALRSWLLADYVAPYCRSLAATRIFRRCFWLDALGGIRAASKKAGLIQEGDSARPYIFDAFNEAEQSNHGSSLTGKAAKGAHSKALSPALQAVAALAGELGRESKPITLQGIVLDGGKGGVPQDSFVLPKESGVINASWREAAPVVLPAIEQTAAVFALNPLAVSRATVSRKLSQAAQEGEGGRPQGALPHVRPTPALTMNGVPFLTVEELAAVVQRTAPTEVCLLLMHREVERVFLPALRSAAGAAAFTGLLRSDRWKAVLAKEGEIGLQVDRAIDLWLASLKPPFPFVQRVAFPLLMGPAAVGDAACSLLFATRRQDSLVCMNDAVCGYRRRLEQESRQGILNGGWFAAQQAERDAQALQQLSEDMLREGRARLPRRWPDLRQQLLLERFGQWMLSEYDEIICRLLEADEVRCEWRLANHGDLPKRVPGHEDMLQWQWKKRRP